MERYIYTAIFTKEETGEYSIELKDFDGCITQGKSLSDGILMAKDALGIFIKHLKKTDKDLPAATEPQNTELKKDQFTTLVDLDYTKYEKENPESQLHYVFEKDNEIVILPKHTEDLGPGLIKNIFKKTGLPLDDIDSTTL